MLPLGIVFIVLGTGLIVAEFFTGSGLFAVGGIVSIIIGLVVLFVGGSLVIQIDWWLATLIGLIVAGVLAFVVLRIRNTYLRQATTGKEDLKGKTAVVKESLDPEGTVFYQGELWNAISLSGKIQAGEEVIINKVDGLRLSVIKKEKE